MPRESRKILNCNVFHVMVQGINKEYIFDTELLKKKYEKLMQDALKKYDVKDISHCIMDNHAHMILFTNEIEEMSNFMKSINISFSKYYNNVKNRVGVVFRNRYESEPILNRKYLFNCIAYVHNNPVKAKMVAKPSQYKYSSYNKFINGTVEDDILELIFGTKVNYLDTFIKMHKNDVEYDFIDFAEDVDYDKKIKELLNINIGEIIMDEKLLAKTVKSLIVENKVPINKVCEVFKLTRYKINKILKNDSV